MSKTKAPSGQSVFQLVADPTEKMRIIYALIKSRQDMIAKSTEPDSEIFLLEARNIQGSELLTKPSKEGLLPLRPKDKELILQFQVGEEKYISQVPCQITGEYLSLSMERKLFRIQRREFFRMILPVRFRGLLTVESIAGIPIKQKLTLLDISGGGCRVKTESTDLPAGVAFEAVLKIPGRDDFKLKCTIRHQGDVADKSGDKWLGIQFTHTSEKEGSRMAALVMDLYRQYFSRL